MFQLEQKNVVVVGCRKESEGIKTFLIIPGCRKCQDKVNIGSTIFHVPKVP